MYKTYCYNPRLLRLWTGKEKKEYFPLCLYYAATIVMITADKKKKIIVHIVIRRPETSK